MDPRTYNDCNSWLKVQQQPQDLEELQDNTNQDSNSTKYGELIENTTHYEESRHDVFLSLQDCDSYFTNKLYNALYERKINAFKDVGSIGLREDIFPTVVREAFEESRIIIIVFSSFYAYSIRCIEALAMIINSIATKGKLVFPIFYYTDPSKVRHQSGSFGLAMTKHGHRLNNDIKMQRWKFALSEASHMLGWSITRMYKEENVILRIVEVVSHRLHLEQLTKSVQSIGNTMEHGGPGHDVSILSFEEAYSDSNIFVGDLYEALYESNINAFKDVGSSEWSEDSGPIALRAIKESRISIIVFSESDAYSEWCLDALVMILDCVKTKGKLVLPVFYNVDPSEVSHQTVIFGLAMAELEDKLQDNMEKVEKWRLALSEAAHRLGWSLEKGEEIDVIPNIVEEVSNHLRFEHLTRSEE
ncbi:disease resistance protein L6-like isoform X2 [Prosopis cineraria]|uniref:disease resistance protein L6-like isoform X2 n=1 Tax=Prosopis cineraria TaxID=364024 RepID=UPI0024109316|nr:disease resistance protein L6-like isoform X2 [Prosopis cineraria]